MSGVTYLLSLSALDLSGGSTLRPFLPIIAENMGASSLEIGFLSSLYAIFQIIFGPILGNLSDNIGRKKLLLFSFLSSSLTPFIIICINIFKYNYYYLYLSIIPMAIFRHSQSCIKSIIVDQQQQNKTFNLMAKWSCSCYIGSTFGPLLISLIIDKNSINTICIISICLFLIAFGITKLFINDNNNNNKHFKLKKSKQFSFSNINNLFNIKYPNKEIRNLIFYHFIAYFALNLYRSGFILILKHRFELEMTSLAKILSYKGIIGFVMQLYLTQYKQYKNEYNLLSYSTLCLSISMILYGFIHNIYYLYLILIFQECGESMFRTSFQTVFANNISKLNNKNTQTYIGLIDSLSSFNRSITPIIFAIIPVQFRYFITPIFAGICDLFLFLTQKPKYLKTL